jgi:hypothetical protein
LLLTAGEMAQRRVLVPLHPDMGERFNRDFLILRSWALEQTQCPIAAHHHRFKNRDRKVAVYDTLLREIPDLRSVVTPQFIAGAIENMEMALDGSHEAQYGSAKCGFSRSVGTDDADKLARVDGKRNVLERDDAGKSERRVIKPNDGLMGVWHETRRSFRR